MVGIGLDFFVCCLIDEVRCVEVEEEEEIGFESD